MAPPFVFSVALITFCCLVFVKPEPLELSDEKFRLPPVRLAVYLALFALAIAIVFRGIPYWIGLVIIPAVLLAADRKALLAGDWPLLLTFVFFFIFAGNMSRTGIVRQFLSGLLERNTLVFSVLSCQFISNVIASLASLITFREYVKHNPGKSGAYVKEFSLFNFSFLILLTGFMLLLKTAAQHGS